MPVLRSSVYFRNWSNIGSVPLGHFRLHELQHVQFAQKHWSEMEVQFSEQTLLPVSPFNCSVMMSLRQNVLSRHSRRHLLELHSAMVFISSLVHALTLAFKTYRILIENRWFLPALPICCIYWRGERGKPQWITISTSGMSIPIPNAMVTTTILSDPSTCLNLSRIRFWSRGSVALQYISTMVLLVLATLLAKARSPRPFSR